VYPFPSATSRDTRIIETNTLQTFGNVTSDGPGRTTTQQPPVSQRAVRSRPGLMSVSTTEFAAASAGDRAPSRHSGAAPGRVPRIRWVCALAAVAVAGISINGIEPMRVHYYETALGEHRTISCRNSLITLNTQSRLAIQCARNLLRARVLRGEAAFRIANDSSSAAIVSAGDAQVDGIGTTFSLRQDVDRSIVTVIEGSVTLSALDSGQHGTAAAAGGRARSVTSVPTIDEMPVWSGERSAVVNTGSKVFLETLRKGGGLPTR
jgi:ferric-dicitrate binding protein FerR (iron transport regulator)